MSLKSFTLKNRNGLEMRVINLGGIITHLFVPDRQGKMGDVVLGFDEPSDYLTQPHPYFGSLVGRYANRIKKGKFQIKGQLYQLAGNNNGHHLHGGLKGFDKVYWQCDPLDDSTLMLQYLSSDGEEGYPGNLKVKVMYSLTDENEVKIDYKASCDRPTPVNLTQHSYFNLSAQAKKIYEHELMIDADFITEVTEELIPTGKLIVVDEPMDFRTPRTIGEFLMMVKGGYDHNYVLNGRMGSLRKVAALSEPGSGRLMEVFTTQPGLQFYSGNFLDGSLKGKAGHSYGQHEGLCLETQHFPDSPNHPEFPSTLLRPGDIYQHTTIYRFGTSK